MLANKPSFIISQLSTLAAHKGFCYTTRICHNSLVVYLQWCPQIFAQPATARGHLLQPAAVGFMSFVWLVPATNLMWHKYWGRGDAEGKSSAHVGRHIMHYALCYCYCCRCCCRSVHYKIQKIFDLISA